MAVLRDSYSNLVVQSKVITFAKYSWTKVEKRIWYIILNQIHQYAKRESEYGRILTLDKNLVLTFDSALLIDAHEHITRSCQVLAQLRKKSIEIETEDRWITIGIINYAEYYKQKREIEVEISKKILPYLCLLSKNFTMYSLQVAIQFHSVYAQRFYELCHQYRSKGFFFFDIEVLKALFLITDKYERYSCFVEKVIGAAEKELKESYKKGQSELYFEWEPDIMSKNGKKVQRLHFTIITEQMDPFARYSITDYIYFIRTELFRYFRNLRYIDRVISFIMAHQARAPEILYKIREKEAQYDKKDMPKILRKVFREDFGVE